MQLISEVLKLKQVTFDAPCSIHYVMMVVDVYSGIHSSRRFRVCSEVSW